MTRKQVLFGDSSFTFRGSMRDWDAANVSGVTLTITDTGGTSMQAATAATLYTQVTISAATSGTNTVTLSAGAGNVTAGDWLKITSGAREEIEVLSYNSTTRVVTLVDDLQYDHDALSTLDALFCTVAVDVSGSTYTKGKQLRLLWTPAGTDDLPYTELAEVSGSVLGGSEFFEELRTVYPLQFGDSDPPRVDALEQIARRRLENDLKARGCNMNRIQDSGLTIAPLVELAHLLAVQGGDSSFADEIERAQDSYNREFEKLVTQPIWVDDNQDGVEDLDTEVQAFDGGPFVERNM